MIKLLGKIPRTLYVGVSGGVDSMVLYNFLRRKHSVVPVFVDHRTENSRAAYKFLVDTLIDTQRVPLMVFTISGSKPVEHSWEEHWRNERYRAFASLGGTVAVGHHLQDSVETYLWSAIHGNPKIIPYKRNNVIRPLLTTSKKNITDWATRHNVMWIDDPSNSDLKYTRNRIRSNLLPEVLAINPGIEKIVRKMTVKQFNQSIFDTPSFM